MSEQQILPVVPPFELIAPHGLMTPNAFMSAVFEQGGDYGQSFGVENNANEYAEPGYSAPKNGILFGNWNNERNDTKKRRSRFARIAEYAGFALEWSDEWTTCEDCGKAVRTSADSYDWQPSYTMPDVCSIVCLDCTDWPAYLESIEDNAHKACTADVDPSDYGYTRLSDAREYQNGWHPCQNDNPTKILADAHKRGLSGILFRIPSVGQFDVTFETWIRETTADDMEKE